MRSFSIRFFAFSGILFFAVSFHPLWAAGNSVPGQNFQTCDAVPNEVIIKVRKNAIDYLYKSGVSDFFAEILNPNTILEIKPFLTGNRTLAKRKKAETAGLDRIYTIRYEGDESPCIAASRCEQHPYVEYADVRRKRRVSAIPDDPLYNTDQKDYLEFISMPKAWDAVKSLDGDVVVAVIDCGTDIEHQDLLGILWTNSKEIPDNDKDDDGNGFVDDIHGWNFRNNTNNPGGNSSDIGFEHGTHTAGIVCAEADNGKGIAGTSWNARLMAINATDTKDDGIVTYGAEAFLYAAENGASVINCSYSAPDLWKPEQDAVSYALSLGIVIVAAAGNNDSQDKYYPAALDGVIAVAAVFLDGLATNYTNYGNWIDVTAPGSAIMSTGVETEYSLISGTSMSAPLVAGIAALCRTKFPALSGQEISDIIISTADNIDDLNPGLEGLLGAGCVNAEKAVNLAVSVAYESPAGRHENIDVSGGNIKIQTVQSSMTSKPSFFDVRGRRINPPWLGANDGTYRFSTDKLSSGCYICRIQMVGAGSFVDRILLP